MALNDYLPQPADKPNLKQVGVRLQPDEVEKLEALAEEFQVSITATVRALILKGYAETFDA